MGMGTAVMSKKERHLSLGPDYKYDRSKTPEENALAELEHFKGRGFDVSSDPEAEKEILETLKKLDPIIDKDLEELAQELIKQNAAIASR
jgi:hypothetical protein